MSGDAWPGSGSGIVAITLLGACLTSCGGGNEDGGRVPTGDEAKSVRYEANAVVPAEPLARAGHDPSGARGGVPEHAIDGSPVARHDAVRVDSPGGAKSPPRAAPAASVNAPAASSENDYAVLVSASESIALRSEEPGVLRVWIGIAGREPPRDRGTATAGKSLGPGANAALVAPATAGFGVIPQKASCQRLDPAGTQIRYQLHPKARGTFQVGPDVKLFASPDCTGPPLPGLPHRVQVEVAVPFWDATLDGVLDLARVTWNEFLVFWGKG